MGFVVSELLLKSVKELLAMVNGTEVGIPPPPPPPPPPVILKVMVIVALPPVDPVAVIEIAVLLVAEGDPENCPVTVLKVNPAGTAAPPIE